jgi:hypothetical protein
MFLIVAAVAALLTAQFVGASPQETAANPTDLTLAQVVEQLLEANAERAKNLKSYRSRRTY